ncbi:MAG: hypothetical protein L3J71_00225 [Victivallaceae bacterium]|nr:hypothetical protein [Victivallaceae bacterium]
MYIREVKTTNKKTCKVYVKHVLSESVRVNGSPRSRTVMHLGHLELPRDLWPQLAAELTARLTGQHPGIKIKKRVQTTADQAMATFYLREEQHRSKLERKTTENETLEVRLDDNFSAMRPTLVMDRGIATIENIDLLKEYGFPYVLITRGSRNKHYFDEFSNYKTDEKFETIFYSEKVVVP